MKASLPAMIAILAASLTASTSLASQPAKIDVVLFSVAPALPLFVAQDKGFFEEHGLEVTLNPTPDAPYLISSLASNDYQIALAGMDNFIAYQADQHVTPYQAGQDVFVFMGGGQTNLPLVVRPEIESFDELRGKTLAVDTPSTGFGFVLYRMLEEGGLSREDYELVEAGATPRRWQGLQEGRFDGTLLIGGLAQEARAQGYNVLAESLDVLDSYQGTVLAANQEWARANSDSLTHFSMAVLDALDWLFDPDNAEETAEILARHLDMPVEAARGAVAGLTASEGGALTRDGAILQEGMRTVIDLRKDYAEAVDELDDPSTFLDLTYYEEAKRRRQR